MKWIPVSERLPEVEVEVLICTSNDVVTTAMYEDGKMYEKDSCWNWECLNFYGKYDDEKDEWIVPEGWWEHRHFNPDDVYNNVIEFEVVAWMPMPKPCKGE